MDMWLISHFFLTRPVFASRFLSLDSGDNLGDTGPSSRLERLTLKKKHTIGKLLIAIVIFMENINMYFSGPTTLELSGIFRIFFFSSFNFFS